MEVWSRAEDFLGCLNCPAVDPGPPTQEELIQQKPSLGIPHRLHHYIAMTEMSWEL